LDSGIAAVWCAPIVVTPTVRSSKTKNDGISRHEKMAILRAHLVEKAAVSEVYEKHVESN
jgi:hypothetical protein